MGAGAAVETTAGCVGVSVFCWSGAAQTHNRSYKTNKATATGTSQEITLQWSTTAVRELSRLQD